MNKLFLPLIGFFVIFLPFNSIAGSDKELKAEEIVAKVKEYYSKIKTVKGEMTITREIEGQKQKIFANFIFSIPNKIHIEYIDPIKEDYIVDGEHFWIYHRAKKEVEKVPLAKSAERGLQPDSLFMINPLTTMEKGYDFIRIEDYDNCYIIQATPQREGINLSRVLLKVDPQNFFVRAYELFDKSSQLISQTKYDKYKEVDKGIFFPLRIEARAMISGSKVVEITDYSHIKINPFIEDNAFNPTFPAEVKVIEMPLK